MRVHDDGGTYRLDTLVAQNVEKDCVGLVGGRAQSDLYCWLVLFPKHARATAGASISLGPVTPNVHLLGGREAKEAQRGGTGRFVDCPEKADGREGM